MADQKKKMPVWKRILWIVLATIFIGVLGLFLFYQQKLNLIHYDSGAQSMDLDASYPLEEGAQQEGLPDGTNQIQLPEGEIFSDSQVFNLLLLGTDERTSEFSTNARADSMMVLSVHKGNHTLKLVSIERGIGVPIPGRNDDLITHAFRYGGADLCLQIVRDCFQLDVNRYVRVNFHFFEQIVNAVGGVNIVLTQREADALNGKITTNAVTKNPVQAGENHLDGYDALQYSRLRYIDSDWKRIERQRKVIQAIAQKLSDASLMELNDLADQVLPLVQTNLTKGEITSLLLESPGFMGKPIEDMTIPTADTCWNMTGVDGRKMIGVDFQKNAQILREFFYES
ncbi:MAG: LCP family protein [Massiliimalia sp.]|jgi:LCP family protein required for cell wall assembly